MSVSIKEIFKTLTEVVEQPYEKAKAWKEQTGGKVIATFPMHFPEELVHASGAYPLVLQTIDEPVTSGHAYYYPFFCGPTRSIVDQTTKGYLDFLDAVLVGDYCIQVVGAGEVLWAKLPKTRNLFFRFPVGNQPWTASDLVDGIKEIKSDIEAVVGKEITAEAIRNSIRIYNKNRSLMRKIYELRKSNPEIISSKEMVTIVKASMVMPKEEHSAILQNLLQELPKRLIAKKGGVRVYISGSLCGAPKFDILSMIEQSGAVVVGDDLFHGLRYISTDISADQEPIQAIADFYMQQNQVVPCPTRCDPNTNWPQYLVQSMKETESSKLIIFMTKFCEPHMFFYPDIKEAMEAAGFAHLLIEMEHEVVSLESLRTRVEAFIEMEQFLAG